MNFHQFKLDLEKAEESEIKLPTSTASRKKQENSRTSTSALLTMPKPLTVWITINHGKFWKRWEYQTTCLLRNLYAGQEATVRTVHGQSEWLRSKSLQAINAGEGVEKREPSYTVGGNAN